jgi:hypothetical protein
MERNGWIDGTHGCLGRFSCSNSLLVSCPLLVLYVLAFSHLHTASTCLHSWGVLILLFLSSYLLRTFLRNIKKLMGDPFEG